MSSKSKSQHVQLKKFTFKQIQEKVAERWEIPEYYDILMEAAVQEETDGIQFNLKHPSFQKLIKLVKEHDATKKVKHPKSSSSMAIPKKKSSSKSRSEQKQSPSSMSPQENKLRVINRSRKSTKKVKSQQEWLDILTEQLSSHSPNAKIVREACKHVGIPINLRATIWKILLNVPKKKAKLFQRQNKDYYSSPHNKFKTKPRNGKNADTASSVQDANKDRDSNQNFEPLRDDPPPLYNQRVIQADIERTRPTMKCFQESAIRHEMEIILTEYCHRKKVSYKQGMNYVLAPFFMIEMKDRLDIYLCFESFIETYLNSTFNDEEFGSLQCIFRMFRLLIQYHDPSLSTFLDHHEIMPELFASGWFMTIHANKCDQATLLHLWDEILLENEICFHYFIDVEILRQNKQEILKRSQEELPQFLVNLVIEDRDYARRLLKEARKTSMNTPISFHEMLTTCSNQKIPVDSHHYVRLEKLPCLSIEPKELIAHCYAEQLLQNAQAGDDSIYDVPSNASMPSNQSSSSSHHHTPNSHLEDNTPNGTHKKFKFAMKRKSKDKEAKEKEKSKEKDRERDRDRDRDREREKDKESTPSRQPPPPIPLSANQHGSNREDDEETTNKKYSRKVRKLLKQSTKYAEQKNLKFFILDCRSLEEYEAGHLPCAYWIDPKSDVSSEQLREKLTSLLEMKGCHFVLFFDGRHNSSDQLLLNNNDPLSLQQQQQDLFYGGNNNFDDNINLDEYQDEQQIFRQSLLYFFLEKRIKYISICESGYAGCHELIVGNLELVDHNFDRCLECNGKWKNSLLSSVKGRFNNLISVAGGSMEKLRNRMIESRQSKNSAINAVPLTTPTSTANAHSSTNTNFIHRASDQTNLPLFVLSNNYDTKTIDFEYRENIHLCKNEPLLMIYLSILRDRETKNSEKFQDIAHKLLVLMFSQIFSHHFSGSNWWDSTECYSPLDITYGSVMCKRGIYGVCLNNSCELVLKNLLLSFQPIIRSVIGTLKVEESFTEDKDGIIRSNRQAVALMPKDIDKRIVLIFHDAINQHSSTNELQSAIDALLKLGAKSQNIIVISIIASRQSLILLSQRFKKVHIWCACIDAVNSTNSTKLIPGIGVFQHRYSDAPNSLKSKGKSSSTKKKKVKKKEKTKGKDKETAQETENAEDKAKEKEEKEKSLERNEQENDNETETDNEGSADQEQDAEPETNGDSKQNKEEHDEESKDKDQEETQQNNEAKPEQAEAMETESNHSNDNNTKQSESDTPQQNDTTDLHDNVDTNANADDPANDSSPPVLSSGD